MKILRVYQLLVGVLMMVGIGLAVLSATYIDDTVSVYLVGDSTMSEKQVEDYPETGWGMPFEKYFKETAMIENHARNGRSTRSFIQEGRWEPIVDKLNDGDYVFIQFGHNDEVQTKERSTKPDEFKRYLRQYVNESREKGAIPVLLTPLTRRRFTDDGEPKQTHEYSPLVREVAQELEVHLIDADEKSIALMDEVGEEASKLLFLHLKPCQNPNYPDGLTDNTHFSETGARMMAELIMQGIGELELDLAGHMLEGKE